MEMINKTKLVICTYLSYIYIYLCLAAKHKCFWCQIIRVLMFGVLFYGILFVGVVATSSRERSNTPSSSSVTTYK